MRRILAGPLAGLMVVWALPTATLAAATSPTGHAMSAGIHAHVGPEEEPPPDDEDDLVIIDDDEMEGGEPAGDEGGGEVPPAGDDGGDLDIFGDDDDDSTEPIQPAAGGAVGKADPDSEDEQIKREMGLITVVQRQRMLKRKRFELGPQVGITVNDPYVRHYTIGIDLNYWFTNRIALGLTGTGFIGAKTPRYENIRFQEGLLLTANQTLWQAHVNFTYNPFYGKIAIFNRALLHWEVSTLIGGGALQTRVIPRYESLHDPFTTFSGGGVVGILGRTYIPKVDWLAFELGTRFFIYGDKLEPDGRGPDTGVGGLDMIELDDPDNARDEASLEVAYNVVVMFGVSFFFPTTFEYTTPR